jgi:rSAM/selenodomain-associated transferase 2
MDGGVSVIIPALNEEAVVAGAIRSAFEGGALEVLVSDGGSSDRTAAVAAAEGAHVLSAPAMRSIQLNRGAEAARGSFLIFLHADTLLPSGAAAMVEAALQGADFGGFRISFAEEGASLRLAAVLINLRTRITRCPWGDQAQFIRRDRFLAGGGFREIPLMEDYEMAVRMRRSGKTLVLPARVRTSGRRFLRYGLIRTAARNWRIIAAYRRGVPPEKLARIYRAE